jgi:heme exporter protein CcmD
VAAWYYGSGLYHFVFVALADADTSRNLAAATAYHADATGCELMANYFAMGGYAAFIWPSYALSVLTLAGLAVWSLRANWRAHDMLRRIETQDKIA